MSTPNTIPQDKILSVIKRLGMATFTEIKRAINEFHNQSGGAEQLRKYLAEMVAGGTLSIHTDKNNKGQPVESYGITNSNISNENARNHCKLPCNSKNSLLRKQGRIKRQGSP